MSRRTRREFLLTALASIGTAALGTSARAASFAGPKDGTSLGKLRFLEEFPRVFHNPFDQGLEGRLRPGLRGQDPFDRLA